tara:strand:+ start:621 stop:857 length:237 start_codon:yes stop_codon:yes gene_type:complete
MSLSDKEVALVKGNALKMKGHDISDQSYWFCKRDVKEFIQELKDRLDRWTTDGKNKDNTTKWARTSDIIDEMAGEELI